MSHSISLNSCVVLIVVATSSWLALPAPAVVTTFDNGPEGWSINGHDAVSSTGGNPGSNLEVFFPPHLSYGAVVSNTTNNAFLGDLTRYESPIRISIDHSLSLIESPGSAWIPWIYNAAVLLVDTNDSTDPSLWVSVSYELGTIDSSVSGWQELSVTVDPTEAAVPDGWETGDEDPVTAEPLLPSGRTFASVMASIDQIYFNFNSYSAGEMDLSPALFIPQPPLAVHLQVDNIQLSAVPEPSTGFLLGVGVIGLVFNRGTRRKKQDRMGTNGSPSLGE